MHHVKMDKEALQRFLAAMKRFSKKSLDGSKLKFMYIHAFMYRPRNRQIKKERHYSSSEVL